MSKTKPSKEPDDVSDSDSEEGLSAAEVERRRRQEERREAKRQQQELARIQKEMKAPVAPWVWIAIGATVVLILAGGGIGFLMYTRYAVSLQQRSLQEDYQRADLGRLRQYAPEALGRADALRQQAEAKDGDLSWKQRIAKYREAEEALTQANQAAATNADAFGSALTRFRVLKDEAQKNRLDQYASMLWSRVTDAEATAAAVPEGGFSAAQAAEKLTEVNGFLTTAAEGYVRLREFDAVASRFRKTLAGVETLEWERNVPEDWAAIQGLIKQAEGAQESIDWVRAGEVIRRAEGMVAPALEKIAGMKAAAIEAVGMMEQALKAAADGDMPTAQPAVWAKAQAGAPKAREALADSDYANASRLAGEVTTLLGEAGESVRQARETLSETQARVKALYDRAAPQAAFFSRNAPEAWRQVQADLRRIPDLERQNRTLDLVELTTALQARLEALLKEQERLDADLKSAEARLQAATRSPLYAHLARNYPEPYARLDGLRSTAARRRDRGEIREARELLLQAADSFEAMLRDLDSARTEAQRLSKDLRERQDRFRDGIGRFLRVQAGAITRDLGRLDQLIATDLHADALTLAKDLDKVVPATRFQVSDKGTVIDFARGVMWIADGQTPDGGNAGQPLDWYAALRWAAALRWGGFDDWRLPTEEELRDLSRLAPAERETLFPNTRNTVHWTHVPTQDVDRALAVSLAAGVISREDKRRALHVRAVRQPR